MNDREQRIWDHVYAASCAVAGTTVAVAATKANEAVLALASQEAKTRKLEEAARKKLDGLRSNQTDAGMLDADTSIFELRARAYCSHVGIVSDVPIGASDARLMGRAWAQIGAFAQAQVDAFGRWPGGTWHEMVAAGLARRVHGDDAPSAVWERRVAAFVRAFPSRSCGAWEEHADVVAAWWSGLPDEQCAMVDVMRWLDRDDRAPGMPLGSPVVAGVYTAWEVVGSEPNMRYGHAPIESQLGLLASARTASQALRLSGFGAVHARPVRIATLDGESGWLLDHDTQEDPVPIWSDVDRFFLYMANVRLTDAEREAAGVPALDDPGLLLVQPGMRLVWRVDYVNGPHFFNEESKALTVFARHSVEGGVATPAFFLTIDGRVGWCFGSPSPSCDPCGAPLPRSVAIHRDIRSMLRSLALGKLTAEERRVAGIGDPDDATGRSQVQKSPFRA